MTEKEIAVKCYIQNIKEAKIKAPAFDVLCKDDYETIAKESIYQAQIFLEVYRTVDVPDDILNIP
tara:strand:+ start:2377 stop:2571 length:195 start_codon:yes stop_codon:yes gene_type:complete